MHPGRFACQLNPNRFTLVAVCIGECLLGRFHGFVRRAIGRVEPVVLKPLD